MKIKYAHLWKHVMKKKIIISNWKLHGNMKLLETLLQPLNKFFSQYTQKNKFKKLIILPPYLYLYPAKKIISCKNIFIGSQNVDVNLSGAFTGEISIDMLKDIGVKYVLVGHSERREHHQENDISIAKKFKLVKDANLIPILCIGETKKDYLLSRTQEICKTQIKSIFDLLGKTGFCNSIIAYEPRWVIGSKNIPSISFITNILTFITNYILKKQNSNKKSFHVQYGGAINNNNVTEFENVNCIDGYLIGSSSLSLECFIDIIKKL